MPLTAQAIKSAFLVQTVGVIVVIFCLALMAVIVSIVGKIMVSAGKAKAAKELAAKSLAIPVETAVAPTASASTSPATLTPEIVAVIAAAVDIALAGRGHRIIDIQQSASSAWAVAGRTDIYASRRLK